jgi:hypothetical protein
LSRLADAVDRCVAAGGTRRPAGERGVLLHGQVHRRLTEISRCRALVTGLERIELLRRLRAYWYFAPETPDPLPWCTSSAPAIRSRPTPSCGHWRELRNRLARFSDS